MRFKILETLPVCQRHHAVSLLFSNDLYLLDFLLNADRSTLRENSKTLWEESEFLPLEEKVLVRIGLHFWTELSSLCFFEAYCCLNEHRFEGFLMANQVLRTPPVKKCICEQCLNPLEWNTKRHNILWNQHAK